MAQEMKFTPEEVTTVLRGYTDDAQLETCTKDEQLMGTLCAGYQSEKLIGFTSKANQDVMNAIEHDKAMYPDTPQTAEYISDIMEISSTDVDSRKRVERVMAALEAGEDPSKYTAKIKMEFSRPNAAGEKYIQANMSFPRKELKFKQEIELGNGDVKLTITDEQAAELHSIGRMNSLVDGVDMNTGELRPFFVAVDKDLKTLKFREASKVKIQPFVYSVELLDKAKIAELKQGKVVMIDIKSKGVPKTVPMYFDPVTSKLQGVKLPNENQQVRTAESQSQIESVNQAAAERKAAAKAEKAEPGKIEASADLQKVQKKGAATKKQGAPAKKQGRGV